MYLIVIFPSLHAYSILLVYSVLESESILVPVFQLKHSVYSYEIACFYPKYNIVLAHMTLYWHTFLIILASIALQISANQDHIDSKGKLTIRNKHNAKHSKIFYSHLSTKSKCSAYFFQTKQVINALNGVPPCILASLFYYSCEYLHYFLIQTDK